MWEHARCGISDLFELKLHSDALTVCAARHWLLNAPAYKRLSHLVAEIQQLGEAAQRWKWRHLWVRRWTRSCPVGRERVTVADSWCDEAYWCADRTGVGCFCAEW